MQQCTLQVPIECSYGKHNFDLFFDSIKFASDHFIVNPLPVVSKLEPDLLRLSGHRLITVHGENFDFFNFGATCRIGHQVLDATLVNHNMLVLDASILLLVPNVTLDVQFVYMHQIIWTSPSGLLTKVLVINHHSPSWLWSYGGTVSFEGSQFPFFSFECALDDVVVSNNLNTCTFEPKYQFSPGLVSLICRLDHVVIYTSNIRILSFPLQLAVSPLELYQNVTSTITLRGFLPNVTMCLLDESKFA